MTSARRDATSAALSRVAILLPLVLIAAGASARAQSPPAAACFAPDTPPEVVAEIEQRLAGLPISLAAPADGFQFDDLDRWSATATNGGGLTQGQPTTLTWSYVPDGTSVCGYAGEPTAGSTLHAWLNGVYGNFAAWHAVFQQVFDRWGALTGTRYIYEPNDDGAALGCSSLPTGVLGVRGDVRITAHPIDGNSGILAYNFFPNAGEMVLDANDSFYNNLGSSSLRMRNVLAHEHGHGLGFDHSCPVNQTKLMEPYVSVAFDGPQHDDILAGNRGYGDDDENDDTPAAAVALGPVAGGASLTVADRSIDDNGDVDWLSFDTTEAVRVTIALTPVGSSYLAGPQNSNGTCSAGVSFNSLAIHDLGLELRAADGVTVLASANANGAGAGETISSLDLSTPGRYLLRIAGPATNSVQMYALGLDAQSLAAPDLSIAFAVAPAAGPVPVGSELAWSLTVQNSGNGAADGVVARACIDADLDPAGLTILDGGLLDGGSPPAGCATSWIEWTLPGALAPDSAATVSYRAWIPLATPDGASITVPGELSSNQTAPLAGNPSPVAVCAPAMGLTMAADAATYSEGDPVTWTITAANSHASCAVTGVTIDDTIDLSLVEDEPILTWTIPPGALVARNDNTIRWALASMAPGATETITISSRLRAGSAGALLCNQASGNWNETVAGITSNAACATVAGGCPMSGVGRVEGLHVVKSLVPEDLNLVWSPAAGAQEYDLWRIENDKTALASPSRTSGDPVVAVSGCAFPSPTAATVCTDSGAMTLPGTLFYQVRGVCGGSEGAL